MTKIIVDSTTDLPKDIIKDYEMDVLPLRVFIEDREYLDKADISIEEVYDAMRKGIYPKTSLPTPNSIYEMFMKYASKGVNFIYYCFSSKLSGTYQAAHIIIEDLKKEFPNVKMAILDTKAGSIASGLIALQGAKMARLGTKFEDIIEASMENIKSIEHIFTLNDLRWLLKGGRIKRSSAVIGSALNIKPILDVQDGEIKVIKKIRGRKNALKALVEMVYERIKNFPNQVIGIAHADDLDVALRLKNMLAEKIGHNNIFIERIGSVLGAHLGIGGVGVFFFNKRTKGYIDEI
jgi:DegV family protein with EDD domain